MKRNRYTLLAVLVILLMILTACDGKSQVNLDMAAPDAQTTQSTQAATSQSESQKFTSGDTEDIGDLESLKFVGQVYLYGESHSVEKILDRELELWKGYYEEKGMRHLFIEMPYYTGELLNLWMKSDNDEILDRIYQDWTGTLSQTPEVLNYFKTFKAKFPETIFHGTDVGHQYDTTGKRYLKYLEDNSLSETASYGLTLEAIEQGKKYYDGDDDKYRENTMTKNFIRELEKLEGTDIMGIYGAAHTGLDAMDFTNSVPCMANQLANVYGELIHSEDLSELAKDIEAIRVDHITVGDTEYEALYFGKQDLTGFKDYASREFWRLENAYEVFKDKPRNGDSLPYYNYPMLIEIGQVFVIDYTKTDGSVSRMYYRSAGNLFKGSPSTDGFVE